MGASLTLPQISNSVKDELVQLLLLELEQTSSKLRCMSIQEGRSLRCTVWSASICLGYCLRQKGSDKISRKLETESTRHLSGYREKGVVASTVKYLEYLMHDYSQLCECRNTACEVLGSIARAFGPGNIVHDVEWDKILSALLSESNYKSAMEFGVLHYAHRKEIASVVNSFIRSTERKSQIDFYSALLSLTFISI